MDNCDGVSEVRKCVVGVFRAGNKWKARVRHPKKKLSVYLGLYDTHEEAAFAVKRKKAEFEEKLNDKVGVKMDTNDGVSEVRKRVIGVFRAGKKWKARVRHPKKKLSVYLGLYDTHEEAVVAVKRKKAEFEETFKGENSPGLDTCKGGLKEINLPPGVRRSGLARWGCYDTPEEASVVVEKKRAEFLKMYGDVGCQQKVIRVCKRSKKVSDEVTDDLKVPAGWRKLESGKWNLKSRTGIRFGVFENQGKAEKPKHGVVSVHDTLKFAFVNSSPTSVFELGSSKTGRVPDFDEAIRLGFINEYGELLGVYSKLDEQMDFCLPGEDVTEPNKI